MNSGVKNKKLRLFVGFIFLFTASLMFASCVAVRTTIESGSAYLEEPSMELVLDRLNTAASASGLVDVMLNEMAISDTANWPRRLDGITEKDLQPVFRALALDGAYMSHGGLISPIKAHVVQVQDILYELPPDMYSASGDYYQTGEATIINGYFYRVKSYNNIIKKTSPSARELKEGIATAAKHIFIKNSKGQIEKRRGKVKSFQITGNQKYDNLMEAIYEIAPNGEELRDANEEYRDARLNYQQLIDRVSLLQKDKTRVINKERPVGQYQSRAEIEEQLNIDNSQLAEFKLTLEEKNNILKKELDNIGQHRGVIDDPESVRVLLNIVSACEGAEGFLAESIGLTTIALAKLPSSLQNVSNEFKNLNPRGGARKSAPKGIFGLISKQDTKVASTVWLPLRMARLRFNIGNIGDTITTIANVLQNDLSLVMDIHQKASMLLNPQVAAEMKNIMKAEPLTEDVIMIAAAPVLVPKKVPYSAISAPKTLNKEMEIQAILAKLGYQPGPVDGKPGKKTRNAIKTFQKDFQYPQTGVPNDMFLTIVRCASDMKFIEGIDINGDPGCIKVFFKDVQSSLTQLGFKPGGVDGHPGKKTHEAIKSFQAKYNYLITGQPSRTTLTQLQKTLKEKGI